MKIKLAGIINDSINNGQGIRKVIFAQGCNHNCKGCFNPETHDFNGGKEFNTKDIIKKINDDFIINGVTFSGGDPFEQANAFIEIAKNINNNLNVWCYTGYTLEYILKSNKTEWNEFLKYIDVLVDGKFEIDKKDDSIKYRGSYNQRLIDVKKSLKNDSIKLFMEEI